VFNKEWKAFFLRSYAVCLISQDSVAAIRSIIWRAIFAKYSNFEIAKWTTRKSQWWRVEQYIFQDICFGGVMDKLGYKISGRHDWSWAT